MKFYFFIVVFLALCTLLCRGGGKQKVSWEEMEEKIASVDTENKDMLSTTIPPLIFILGVQKGGSSSLMWHIITHPQLCSGVRKETHFFGGNYEKLVDQDTGRYTSKVYIQTTHIPHQHNINAATLTQHTLRVRSHRGKVFIIIQRQKMHRIW